MSDHFPFAALVGVETLQMALQLAAIDRRLSVLVRGDKGAGKSTAARGLAAARRSARPPAWSISRSRKYFAESRVVFSQH